MALADVSRKEMCQLEKVYFNTFPTINNSSYTTIPTSGLPQLTQLIFLSVMVRNVLAVD
jgi:hypothetical protein